MSRIGKLPIAIPDGVEVKIDGQTVTTKGPLGTLTVEIRPEITVKIEDKQVLVTRNNELRETRSLHGLSRTLVANAINGVKTGFEKNLEIVGVGYRAQMNGTTLNLVLGYSHPIDIVPPQGIKIEVDQKQNTIKVSGPDKQVVGDIAALIRSKRPPEVYKGKGIKYQGEHIRRKVGKTGKK